MLIQIQTRMKKIFTLLIPLLILPVCLTGQMANRQAGMRLGYTTGLFYQVGTEAGSAGLAYNLMLSFRKHGLQFTGLRIVYEKTLDAISPDLYFAWGYGGHAGFINSDHIRSMGEDYYFHGDRFCPLVGADGWIAAEYRVNEIPLHISLNLKPFVELTFPSFVRIMPGDFAFSIAYVF